MWGQQKDFAFRLLQEVNLLKDISHVWALNSQTATVANVLQPNIIHIERVLYTENTM